MCHSGMPPPPFAVSHPTGGVTVTQSILGTRSAVIRSGYPTVGSGAIGGYAVPGMSTQEQSHTMLAEKRVMVLASRCIEQESTLPHQS